MSDTTQAWALRPYRLTYARPVQTSVCRRSDRRGWLLSLTTPDGLTGWGDAGPWPGFGESEDVVEQTLRQFVAAPSDFATLDTPDVSHLNAIDIGDYVNHLRLPAVAKFAAESALLDVLGQREGVPIAALIAPKTQRAIRSCSPASVPEVATEAFAQGRRCFKVKVGAHDIAADVDTVAQIRAQLGDTVELRLDANGAWNAERALEFIQAVESSRPALLEQPVPALDLAGLARVTANSSIPIYADESVSAINAEQLYSLMRARHVDGLVIKPGAVGGLLRARSIAREAAKADLPCIVSTLWESAVGRTAALHLACALAAEQETPAAGLGAPASSNTAPEPMQEGDVMRLPVGSGLGVTPFAEAPQTARTTEQYAC